jgi:hypothetical protein
MRQTSRAWIFVSHTNKDLEKVREVRNHLESVGAEPILFFLKCLSDHDEIDDLIKREIEARYFFLLCDSREARKSMWVKDEIAHVQSLTGRIIEVINLDADWRSQLSRITDLVASASAFICCSLKDQKDAEKIERILTLHDFSTFDPISDISAGENFSRAIEEALELALRYGFFLHLLSIHSLSSEWCMKEAEIAVQRAIEGRYIPICIDSPEILMSSGLMPDYLRLIRWLDFSHGSIQRFTPNLLSAIGMKS